MRRIQDPSQQNSEGGWRSGRCGNQQRKARERQFRCDHRRSGRTDRFSPWNETTLSGAQGALHGRNHRKSPRSAPRVSRRPTDGRGMTNACLHLGLVSEGRREWHDTTRHRTHREDPRPPRVLVRRMTESARFVRTTLCPRHGTSALCRRTKPQLPRNAPPNSSKPRDRQGILVDRETTPKDSMLPGAAVPLATKHECVPACRRLSIQRKTHPKR